jgi:hypothetical protein
LEIPNREQHSIRLQALIEDALDYFERNHADGFQLGPIALVAEVLVEGDPPKEVRRVDVGYTPAPEAYSYFSFWCSDDRRWLQAAMFRSAHMYAQEAADAAESWYLDHSDDDEDDNDDG